MVMLHTYLYSGKLLNYHSNIQKKELNFTKPSFIGGLFNLYAIFKI